MSESLKASFAVPSRVVGLASMMAGAALNRQQSEELCAKNLLITNKQFREYIEKENIIAGCAVEKIPDETTKGPPERYRVLAVGSKATHLLLVPWGSEGVMPKKFHPMSCRRVQE